MKTKNKEGSFASSRAGISRWRTLGRFIVTAGLVASCVPTAPSDQQLKDTVVLTRRAPGTDFGSYKTFFLRPEIIELKEEDSEPLPDDIAQPLLAATQEHLIDRGFVAAASKEEADLAVEMVYVNTQWVASSCYSWWDGYYWGYPGYPYYPYYGCTASTWETHTLATSIVDLTTARATGTKTSSLLLALDGGVVPDGGVPADASAGGGGSGAGGSGGATPVDGGDGTGGSSSGTGGTGGATTDSGSPGPSPILAGIWFSGVYGIVYGGVADSVQKGLDGIDQAFAQSPYLTTDK
jgi:uncharacterized membrane protein YgcG